MKDTADPRGLRKKHRLPGRIKHSPTNSNDECMYYEAQISFLLTGVDEWHWTAYCCVDTFFGGNESAKWYGGTQFDALPGGVKMAFWPVWNPREYYLLAFAKRLHQATKEWTNAILELDARLDRFVSDYPFPPILSVRLV